MAFGGSADDRRSERRTAARPLDRVSSAADARRPGDRPAVPRLSRPGGEAAFADARRLAQPTYLAVGLALGSLYAALARDQASLTERSDADGSRDRTGSAVLSSLGRHVPRPCEDQTGDFVEGMALLFDGVAAYRKRGRWCDCPVSLPRSQKRMRCLGKHRRRPIC
jgi:hypothetical protein